MASDGTVMQYSGVNEAFVGQKPGLKATKTMVCKRPRRHKSPALPAEPQRSHAQLSYGVYETRTAKLFPQYKGFDESRPCDDSLKLAVTVPAKWIESPTPVSLLRKSFLSAYRKKFPRSALSVAEEDDVSVAIKDESLFLFSKKALDAVRRSHFPTRSPRLATAS